MIIGREFFLNVADFKIHTFIDETNVSLALPDSYFHFLQKDTNNYDVKIKVHNGIPTELLRTKEVFKAPASLNIFRKNDNFKHFWSIHKIKKEKFAVFTSDEVNEIFPYAILCVDFNGRNWDIYINNKKNLKTIDVFKYPIFLLILYYLVALNNSIMIHASAVFDRKNQKGYLFSGISGVGKTTISNIFVNEGFELINDDRLIIREIDNEIFMYSTPMFYKEKNKKVKLDKVFLLKQKKNNEIKELFGVTAISKMMAFCIQHSYHRKLINELLSTLNIFRKNIPIYQMGFFPDNNIVDFLKKFFEK